MDKKHFFQRMKIAAALGLSGAMLLTMLPAAGINAITVNAYSDEDEDDYGERDPYEYEIKYSVLRYDNDKRVIEDDDNHYKLKEGNHISESRMHLPSGSALVKPYPGARFEGWYFTCDDYNGGKATRLSDLVINGIDPNDEYDPYYLNIFPKFDKQLFSYHSDANQNLTVNYISTSGYEEKHELPGIDMSQPVSDEELLAAAEKIDDIDKTCEPTWELTYDNGLQGVRLSTSVRNVKYTCHYTYADYNGNQKESTSKVQYAVNGYFLQRDYDSVKNYRPSDASQYLTGFNCKRPDDDFYDKDDEERVGTDNETRVGTDDEKQPEVDKKIANLSDIQRYVSSAQKNGEELVLEMTPVYNRAHADVNVARPGVSGDNFYNYEYKERDVHSLFYNNGEKITGRSIKDRISQIGKSDNLPEGVEYKGTNRNVRVAKNSNKWNYVDYLEELKDDDEYNEEYFYHTNAEIGNSYVGVIALGSNAETAPWADAQGKAYAAGEQVELPTDTEHYSDIGYYQLYVVNSDGTDKLYMTSGDNDRGWEKYDFSKPLTTEAGKSYYFFGKGKPKTTAPGASKNEYSIFIDNRGGHGIGNRGYYSPDETYTLNNLTRTGYTFLGWVGSNGSVPQTTVTIPEGTTGYLSYYARWKRNETTDTSTGGNTSSGGNTSTGGGSNMSAGGNITSGGGSYNPAPSGGGTLPSGGAATPAPSGGSGSTAPSAGGDQTTTPSTDDNTTPGTAVTPTQSDDASEVIAADKPTTISVRNKKTYKSSKKITIRDTDGIATIRIKGRKTKTIRIKGKKKYSFRLSKYKKYLNSKSKWTRIIITDTNGNKRTIRIKVK